MTSAERDVLISGNWKMHINHFEALKVIQELAALLRSRGGLPEGRSASVHPPFTSIRTVQTAIESDHVPLLLGAQDCSPHDRGAYTGEVSPEMLAKLNVVHVIVGHSERRQHFGESDELVRAKADAVFRNGMRPIVCVGETLAERQGGNAVEKVRGQIAAVFAKRPAEQVAAAIVAYEPIWAIGTGETATPEDAETMCAAIREELVAQAGAIASTTRVQYGGSVTPDSAAALLAQENVDGLLVGGASLEAERFFAIMTAAL